MSSILSTAFQAVQSLSLSILSAVAGPRRVRILVTGLDNAGKTTLLHRLRNAHQDPAPAPLRPGVVSSAFSPTSWTDIRLETVAGSRDLVLGAIDLGAFRYREHPGGVRQLWRDFLTGDDVHGFVFVADAADPERFAEAARLLADLFQLLRKGKRSIPVLVLGNKIDSYNAVSEEELRERLKLAATTTQKDELGGKEEENRTQDGIQVALFMCSVVTGQGYKEGFAWLSQHL